MGSITIKNLQNRKLKVSNKSSSILQIAQENYIDWMHACGGKGRCTTCRAEILEGEEHLSPRNPREEQMAKRLAPNERLACQVKVEGDVIIRIPKGCRFPHVDYSEGDELKVEG